MKIRILGCGPSYGVPSLARGFGDCNPDNSKNIRTRTAMLLQAEQGNIVFDSGPEIRQQLLSAGSPKINAVVYTHAHYDHMGGAEDLRKATNDIENFDGIPVYLTHADAKEFRDLLYFAFPPIAQKNSFHINIITPYQKFDINGLEIFPIKQYHNKGLSMGYRIGDFAYSTDVKNMDKEGFDALKGIKTWVLGVTTPIRNETHINLDEALEWIQQIKPKRAFLTHMGTRMDYDKLCDQLPEYIRPVYDGMEIEI